MLMVSGEKTWTGTVLLIDAGEVFHCCCFADGSFLWIKYSLILGNVG